MQIERCYIQFQFNHAVMYLPNLGNLEGKSRFVINPDFVINPALQKKHKLINGIISTSPFLKFC